MTIMMSIPRSDVAQSPEPRVSISLRLTKGAHITTERFAALMSEVLFTTVDERGFFSAIESGAMARGRVPWRGFDSTAPTLLVKRPLWHGVGLELQPSLAGAAGRNASRLGLAERFRVLEGDVSSSESLRAARRALARQSGAVAGNLPLFDAVFCNPPWRREGEGRLPPSPLRRTALFGTERTFSVFFSAADALLKRGGCLTAVSGAERTAELLAALPSRMRPERLRFVFARPDAPATFVLLMARKNGRSRLCVDRTDGVV